MARKRQQPPLPQTVGKKVYFTFDEQIAKLKSDGLMIADEKRAKARLKWEGYFNFAVGYNRLFKDGKKYVAGTTFEHIEALYDYDRRIRDVVYECTQIIECNLKALVSDVFSKRYGVNERSYLAEENFTDEPSMSPKVRWIVGTCRSTLEDGIRMGSSYYHDYIAYYDKTYGHVPLWALIRALSFGNTSKFLRLMKLADRKEIAKEYGITPDVLCNLTEIAVSFRNVAAHGERVYCAALPKVRLSDDLSILSRLQVPRFADGRRKYAKCDFMAFLIVAKYLLRPTEFARYLQIVKEETQKLEENIPAWAMKRVYEKTGLSGSWKKLDCMQK
ncbi:MAG: Abi family protein [Clostridia bacterium]|nr:Abi family protein [Clostridia bacterium]